MGVAVDDTTRVRLHELAARPDRDEWIVGRMATGSFVALPAVGKRAVDLLGAGLSAAETRERLRAETGEDVEVTVFLRDLIALGFVAEADGRPVPAEPVPRPSLPGLEARHVRWTLAPAVAAGAALLIASALVVLLVSPHLTLNHRTLLWSGHGSLVILLGAGAGWSLLLLHELAHLATARATGVPGRIRLGTRLQFLVMQTDISGIELAPRRHRMTAYLAGAVTNLVTAALALLLAAAFAEPGSAPHRALSALALVAVAPLTFQFMVFMRTDVYFVLQDLTGCRDLYGDGKAYAAHLLRRLGRRAPAGADPSLSLPAHERRAVRLYSVVQVLGTVLCLGFLAVVTVPADLTLLSRAVSGLRAGDTVPEVLDAAAVLLVLGGVHVLWAVTWARGRRRRRASGAPPRSVPR